MVPNLRTTVLNSCSIYISHLGFAQQKDGEDGDRYADKTGISVMRLQTYT